MRDHLRELPNWLAFVARPEPAGAHTWHSASSNYVETYWLPHLGPSAVWLLRRVDRLFADHYPEGVFGIETAELAARLGLGCGLQRNSPTARTLARVAWFGFAKWENDNVIEITRWLPTLGPDRLARLPGSLRARHETECRPVAAVAS